MLFFWILYSLWINIVLNTLAELIFKQNSFKIDYNKNYLLSTILASRYRQGKERGEERIQYPFIEARHGIQG